MTNIEKSTKSKCKIVIIMKAAKNECKNMMNIKK